MNPDASIDTSDQAGFGIVARKPKNLAKSAARALDVMELFGAAQAPRRASQIASDLAMGASSADQLLKTMVHAGYLLFDERTKFYTPSPRLTAFAQWMLSPYFGNERIRPLLDELHRKTQATIVVSTRCRSGMQVIDFSGEEESERMHKGRKVPLAGTVAGTAYLAPHTDQEISEIIERNRLCGTTGLISKAELMDRVHTARELGYSTGAAYQNRFWSVGVTLPPAFGPTQLVIGLGSHAICGREGEYMDVVHREIEAAIN